MNFTKNITYSSYNAFNPYGYGTAQAEYTWHGWGGSKVNTRYGFAGLRSNGSIHYAFAYRFRTPTWSGTEKKITFSFSLMRETTASTDINVSLTSTDPTLSTAYGNSTLPADAGRIASTTVSCSSGEYQYTVEFNVSALAQNTIYYLVISPNGGATNYAVINTVDLAGYVTYEASASEVSASNGNIGSNIPISMTNDGMLHTLKWSFGGRSGTIGSTTGSSYTWSVPAAFSGYIPTATSGTCTITCETEAGTTSTSITLYVPSSVVPTIYHKAIAVVNDNATVAGWGVYLQNYSKIRAALSARASYSTIASWRIDCGVVSFSGDSSLDDIVIDETSEILTAAGTYKVSVTVTDARGRTASYTEFAEFTVQPYTEPSVTNADMYRCRSDGTKDESDGTYLYCRATRSFSSVGGRNTCTMVFQYKERAASTYTSVSLTDNVGIVTGGGLIDVLKAYNMRIRITDALNTTYYTGVVPTQSVPFNIKPSRKSGVGFGMYAQEDEVVELSPDWSLKVSALSKIKIGDSSLAEMLGGIVYPVGAYFWTSNNYASAQAVHDALGFGTWEKITGKFLYAADSGHAAGSTGGNENITLAENQMPSHRHTVPRHNHTVDISHGHTGSVSLDSNGGHSHGVNYGYGGVPRGFMIRDTGTPSGTGSGQAQSVSSGMGFSVANAVTTDNNGSHSHSGSVSVDNAGGTKNTSYVPEQEGYVIATSYVPSSGTQQPINNMPPYQAAYCWHRTA